MNIHPLWIICICIRLLLVYIIYYTNKVTKQYNNLFSLILILIGLGFIYKTYVSSNNEIQIAKVFWHDTRYIHGLLYLLSAYYLLNNNTNMTTILLLLDICFSFLYRIVYNK
jgi:hypothetical protein